MRAGKLRHRIVIQKPTETQDTFGEPAVAWSQYVELWGEVAWQEGGEGFTADRTLGSMPAVISTRYKGGVTQKMRILAPDVVTTLNGGINNSVTSITVDSAAEFPVQGDYRIRIENEIMEVTAGHGTTTWTVTRGVDGTTKAAHVDGKPVELLLVHDIVSPLDVKGRRRELEIETVVRA